MPYTATKRSRSRGSASSLQGGPSSKNASKNNSARKTEKISKYFAKAEKKDDSDSADLSDSPYKNCLNEVKNVKMNNSSDMDDFKTPKAINKVSKITNVKPAQNITKRKKTRQPPLRKFVEDNLKHSDVNPEHLQMALALSESTYEAENPGQTPSSQEKKENFRQAFERYGFGYSKNKISVEKKREILEAKKNKKSKFRFITPILKIRTSEEREALIGSKVSLILAQMNRKSHSNITFESSELFSEKLQKYSADKIYKLNNLELEELNKNRFYVGRLGLETCPASCGRLLKDWRKIPGRETTPEREMTNQSLSNLSSANDRELPSPIAETSVQSESNKEEFSGENSPKSQNEETVVYETENFSYFDAHLSDVAKDVREFINEGSSSKCRLSPNITSPVLGESPDHSLFSNQNSEKNTQKCNKNEDFQMSPLFEKGEEFNTYFEKDFLPTPEDFSTPKTKSSVFNNLPDETNSIKSPGYSKIGNKTSILIIDLDEDTPRRKSIDSLLDFRDFISDEVFPDRTINSPIREESLKSQSTPCETRRSDQNVSRKRQGSTKKSFRKSLSFGGFTECKNSPKCFGINSPDLEGKLKRKSAIANDSQKPERSVDDHKNLKRSRDCISPDLFGSDDDQEFDSAKNCFDFDRLRGGEDKNTKEIECFDLTQSDEEIEEKFHLRLSDPQNCDSRRSDLNVTDYVQNLLSNYKEPSNKKIEKVSTSEDDSQQSQNSIYISDDELNYSSVFSAPPMTDNFESNLNDELNYSSVFSVPPIRENLENNFSDDEFNVALELPLAERIRRKSKGIDRIENLNSNAPPLSEDNSSNKTPIKAVPQLGSTPTLEDSFNQVLNQIPINNTPNNRSFLIKTKNVTPMANYDEMDTPKIAKELDKFGLKPLKRQKGAKLLKYIYESTHPVVEDENGKVVKKRKTTVEKVGAIIGNVGEEGEVILEKKQSKKISSCAVPLHIVWYNFVMSNPKIRENILLYEPLQLEVLHSMIKDQGFKFNIQDLLTFLDRKCITVRVAQGQHHGGKKPR